MGISKSLHHMVFLFMKSMLCGVIIFGDDNVNKTNNECSLHRRLMIIKDNYFIAAAEHNLLLLRLFAVDRVG